MSQFLLVQGEVQEPKVAGFLFTPIQAAEEFVTQAASELFADSNVGIWQATPEGENLDSVVDRSRSAVLRGEHIETTPIGTLIRALLGQGSAFALFWANDFRSLPAPRTEAELFRTLIEQIAGNNTSNWSCYAVWRNGA